MAELFSLSLKPMKYLKPFLPKQTLLDTIILLILTSSLKIPVL